MKKFQLCGLGNAIIDILVRISEQDFKKLGYEKGTMNLIDAEAQSELISRFHSREPVLASGGSVANSIVTFAELGGRAAFTGCFGDDKYGLFYKAEFENFGIELTQAPIVNALSGTCLSLITPDSERTMRTCLGISAILDDAHVSSEVIQESEWIFLEGYLFSNQERGQKAVSKALETAKASGTKVAVTFSDTWVIDNFRSAMSKAVEQSELIFANAAEAMQYTLTDNINSAFEALAGLAPIVIMTAGDKGAYLAYHGEKSHVPAFPTQPVDMTGAGDVFAGAFLYGLEHKINPVKALEGACFLASKVIRQIGARLHSGVRASWDECMQSG